MKVGDTTYYKIIKSCNKLKAYVIKENEMASSALGMKLMLIDDSGAKYARYEYQIEIFQNGIYNDINIEGNSYCFIIKYSPSYYEKVFTIEYSNAKEIRQFKFTSHSETLEDRLCDIIYVMVLLSEIDNVNKVLSIYDFISKKDLSYKTLGVRIDLYKEIKDFAEKIKDKYPFLCYPINIGLQKRLDEIKSDLLKEALIENNL